jgi:hypothetical protein
MNTVLRSVLLVLLFVGAASAQHVDPLEAMNHRASQLIDSTMSRLNLRAERFNEELAQINKARPLDASALTPETIAQNLAKVKDFLGYLEVYRSLSAKSRQTTEDSVAGMRSEMPSRIRKPYLQDFLDAYALDQNAFDKYTVALTNVYTKVSDVLKFLSTAKIKTVSGKIQFDDKAEYESYQDMMTEVTAVNRKLISASAASQKATLEASEQMQKAYGAANK